MLVRAGGLEPPLPFGKRIFLPTTAFAASVSAEFVVWTIPSPWRKRFRCRPSSLYTFPTSMPSLARDRQLQGFPEFERFYTTGFP